MNDVKAIRTLLATALAALLSGGEAWALQATAPKESRLAIVHDPLKCVTADVRPLVDGEMRPGRDLDKGYVYFRAAGTEDFYYVVMKAAVESVAAELPRPLPGIRGIDYFLQAVDRELLSKKTPAYQPPLVEARLCLEGAAEVAPSSETAGRTTVSQAVDATYKGPLPRLAGATIVFTKPAGATGTLSVTRVDGPPTPSTVTPAFLPNDPKTGAGVTDGTRFTPTAVSPSRHWLVSFAKTTGAYTLSLDISDLPGVSDPRKLYVVKRDGPGRPWTALPSFFKSGTLTATVPGGFSEFAIAGGPENPFSSASAPARPPGRRGARTTEGLTVGLTRAGQSPVPPGFDKRDIAFVILAGGAVVTLAEALAGGSAAPSTAAGASKGSGGISTGVLIGAGAAAVAGIAIAAGGSGGGSSSQGPTATPTPRPTTTPTPTPTPTPDLPRFLTASATWSGAGDLNVRVVGPSGDVAQLPGGRTVPAGCATGSRTESVVYAGTASLPAGTYTLFVRHADTCNLPAASVTFSYSVQAAAGTKCGGFGTVSPGAEVTACTFTLP